MFFSLQTLNFVESDEFYTCFILLTHYQELKLGHKYKFNKSNGEYTGKPVWTVLIHEVWRKALTLHLGNFSPNVVGHINEDEND